MVLLEPDRSFNKQKFVSIVKDGYNGIISMVDTCYDSKIKSIEDRFVGRYKVFFCETFHLA